MTFIVQEARRVQSSLSRANEREPPFVSCWGDYGDPGLMVGFYLEVLFQP